MRCKTPQQKNGYDCGLFALRFAEALSNNRCIKIMSEFVDGTIFDSNSLKEYFDEKGGDAEFAPNLRREMLDYLLQEAPATSAKDPRDKDPIQPDYTNKHNDDNDDDEEDEEEDSIFYQATRLSIPASIAPCLSLHCGDEKSPGFPNIHAANFNFRKIELARFGILCNDLDKNIVHQLRCDGNDAQVPLESNVILVFTSFKKMTSNNDLTDNMQFVMKSITHPEDRQSFNHASPLTTDILKKGIMWIQGVEGEEPVIDSIEKGLEMYLGILSKCIPLQQSVADSGRSPSQIMASVVEFINDHKWEEQAEAEALCEKIGDCSRFDDDPTAYEYLCYKVRHFLNRNVAKQTGVITHCVDGIHRWTGVECVLNGHGTDWEEKERITDYHNTLPHSKVNIISKVIPLTDSHVNSAEAFTSAMKRLSSHAQKKIGCLQPLGKKVFFKLMIELLHKDCFEKNVCYYSENADEVEEILDQIIETLGSDQAVNFYDTVPTMMGNVHGVNGSDWKSVFKKQKSKENIFEFDQSFLCSNNRLTALRIMKKFGSLYHESRYQAQNNSSAINAEFFELLMILFWSRLSCATYTQLLDFFSYDSNKLQISTASGHVVNKWLTCMIVNVFSHVHLTSKAILRKDRDDRKRKREGQPLVYLEQLMNAIATCTRYFSAWGTNPVLPPWFLNVSTKLKDVEYVQGQYIQLIKSKGVDVNDESVAVRQDQIQRMIISGWQWELSDFFVFITVAYSLHLHKDELNSISLEDYCASQIIEADASFPEIVTSKFLEFFVPVRPASNNEEEQLLHPTPPIALYAKLEAVVTMFKGMNFISDLRKKKTTTHVEKALVKRLLTVIDEVDLQRFSKIYVEAINEE